MTNRTALLGVHPRVLASLALDLKAQAKKRQRQSQEKFLTLTKPDGRANELGKEDRRTSGSRTDKGVRTVNPAKEFTVQNPAGDLFRVVTGGDMRQAITDARRATRDTRHTIDEWKPISLGPETTSRPSVRQLDEYEKRKHLDVMELLKHSQDDMPTRLK